MVETGSTHLIVLDELVRDSLGIAENEQRLVVRAHPARTKHLLLRRILGLLLALRALAALLLQALRLVRAQARERLLHLDGGADELGVAHRDDLAAPADLDRLLLARATLGIEARREVAPSGHDGAQLAGGNIACDGAHAGRSVLAEAVRAEAQHRLDFVHDLVRERLVGRARGRACEVLEHGVGAAERAEAVGVLAALKGERAALHEGVGLNLRGVRGREAGRQRRVLRERDEGGSVRGSLGEALGEVVLGRGRGGRVIESALEELGLRPAALCIKEDNLEMPVTATKSQQMSGHAARRGAHLSLETWSACTGLPWYLRDLPCDCESPAALRRWCTLATQCDLNTRRQCELQALLQAHETHL